MMSMNAVIREKNVSQLEPFAVNMMKLTALDIAYTKTSTAAQMELNGVNIPNIVKNTAVMKIMDINTVNIHINVNSTVAH